MPWMDAPVTLFRALKLPNAQVVCIDARVLSQTTLVVRNSDEYYKAIGQGWCDEPQQAIDQFEAEEAKVGNAAAERAYQDQRMSEPAQREADAYEATVTTHVPEIPSVPVKKPAKPKKAAK